MPTIDDEVVMALKKKLDSGSFHDKKILLENRCCRECNTFVTLSEWADEMKAIIHTFNISSINTNQFNVIKRNETRLNNLKWLCEIEINLNPIKIPTKSTNFPCSMYDWYAFLIETYDALSVYEVQKNASTYLSINLPTI